MTKDQKLVMSKHPTVFAVLLGLAGALGMPANADPPPPVAAPNTAPSAPPSVAPPAPLRLSPMQQKSRLLEAQRGLLNRQAQALEREATRQTRGRQFDQAQGLYARAASLYHQQARLARQAAQNMAHANQMSLAARAHSEALAADNRYLACLASEVSVIKKSSVAEALPPTLSLPAQPKPPVRVLAQTPKPAPVPRPLQAKRIPKPLQAKRIPKLASVKPLPPRIAAVPPAPKRHIAAVLPRVPKPPPFLALVKPKIALVKPTLISAHAARARKALPPALKALRQAAVRPLKFAPGFIAAQQHGQLQERLRLRRAQLQEAGSDAATPSVSSPVLPSPAP